MDEKKIREIAYQEAMRAIWNFMEIGKRYIFDTQLKDYPKPSSALEKVREEYRRTACEGYASDPHIKDEDRRIFSNAIAADVDLERVANKLGGDFVWLVNLLYYGRATDDMRDKIKLAIDDVALEEGKAI